MDLEEYFSIFLDYGIKIFVHIKLCFKFARSNEVVAYGVIGNTAGFGPVVLGSSPSRPTESLEVKSQCEGIGIFILDEIVQRSGQVFDLLPKLPFT